MILNIGFVFALLQLVTGILLWKLRIVVILFLIIIWFRDVPPELLNVERQQTIEDSRNEEKRNYHRLVHFIINIAQDVIRKYISIKILKGECIKSFLARKRHVVFHMYETRTCCECTQSKVNHVKLISNDQFKLLYIKDQTKFNTKHIKYMSAKSKVRTLCICNIIVNEKCRLDDMDISLASYFVQTFKPTTDMGVDVWTKAITNIRNEVFHCSDMMSITCDKFKRRWEKLSASVSGLANLIDKEFEQNLVKSIDDAEKLNIISDKVLSHERLVHDYFRNKLCEIERLRKENLQKLSPVVKTVGGEELETKYQKVIEKIEILTTTVDKIFVNVSGSDGVTKIMDSKENDTADDNMTIPVLFQIDVPSSWTITKIHDAIEQMRLTASSEKNIRIKEYSTDDMIIFAEIVRKIMKRSTTLQNEIHHMLSEILHLSEIDTAKQASVSLSISLPYNTIPNKGTYLILKSTIKIDDSQDFTGAAFLSDGKIVVKTANTSRCIVYDSEGMYIGELKIHENLEYYNYTLYYFGIINENQIAVHVSARRNKLECVGYVYIFDVATRSLLCEVPLPKKVVLVTTTAKKIVCSVESEGICIVSSSAAGTIEQTIDIAIENSSFIYSTEDRIFLYYKSGQFKCYNYSGKHLFTIAIQKVRCCTCLEDKSLLLVCGEKSDCILHISENGILIERINMEHYNVWFPRSLYFDSKTCQLFILHFGNCVSVFRVENTVM